MNNMLIAFTGHRPDKLGGYDDTKNFKNIFDVLVTKILQEYEDVTVISGMALGVDTWAAKLAISLNIPFLAYVPFKGQESKWPTSSQNEYSDLLLKAKLVNYICTEGYATWKMQKRNEAMVDDCGLLVAVWNGTYGGTKNCVKYAKKINRKIIRIDPLENGFYL
jgi:uncharacterized phage-like protein YoqJ